MNTIVQASYAMFMVPKSGMTLTTDVVSKSSTSSVSGRANTVNHPLTPFR